MKRRAFGALLVSIPLAGCGMLGDGDDGTGGGGGGGGDGSVSATLDATSEDLADYMSSSFDRNAGDELEVTLEAGENGAYISLLPEEDSVSSEDMFDSDDSQLDVEVWDLDSDEEVTDTVEIPDDDTYVFLIWEGSGTVEAE